MAKFANRVKETTDTTGTGTLDLNGAATGFRAFGDELTSGDEVFYLIVDDPDNPTSYEYGVGTFTSGTPDTLSRDTVEGSSQGGSKVSWLSGTKVVIATPTAAALGGEGPIDLSAYATLTGAETLSNKTLAASTVFPAGVEIILAAEQATTSGTAFDFTSIPAGVNRITMMLDSVSLSGSDALLVQLGDAGGIETTGYVSTSTSLSDSAATQAQSSTSGLIIRVAGLANPWIGAMTLNRMSGNKWVAEHTGRIATTATVVGAGNKTLSAELTQIRLTRTGTDTFDAGAVSISYE